MPINYESLVKEVFRSEEGLVRYVKAVGRSVGLHFNEDLEDLVVDTKLKALRSLDRLSDRSAFKPWIGRIARHSAFDLLKKTQRTNSVSLEEVGDTIPDARRGPFEAVANHLLREDLEHCAKLLPPAQRGALTQFTLEETYSRQNKHYAILNLRKCLATKGHDISNGETN